MSKTPVLSRPVEIGSIPATGIERKFTATEAERAALAKAYGLNEVKSFSADLVATAGRRGSVRVQGRVAADIVQACIVSFEPVAQKIDEEIDARYAPYAGSEAPPGSEIEIDVSADDPPEPLTGSSIDLGAIAEEYFVLAIDPYPRAPGAELPAELGGEGGDIGDSPFAALAALRGKAGPGS